MGLIPWDGTCCRWILVLHCQAALCRSAPHCVPGAGALCSAALTPSVFSALFKMINLSHQWCLRAKPWNPKPHGTCWQGNTRSMPPVPEEWRHMKGCVQALSDPKWKPKREKGLKDEPDGNACCFHLWSTWCFDVVFQSFRRGNLSQSAAHGTFDGYKWGSKPTSWAHTEALPVRGIIQSQLPSNAHFFSLPAESKRKFPQINTKALDVHLMAFQGKEAWNHTSYSSP